MTQLALATSPTVAEALERLLAALDAWDADVLIPKADPARSRAVDDEVDAARQAAREALS